MDNEASFYVESSSNASMKVYPENTVSRFSTKLASPLELKDNYEVAVTEIFYPLSLEGNKRKFSLYLIQKDKDAVLFFPFPTKHVSEFIIQDSASVQEICDSVNEAIRQNYKLHIFLIGSLPSFSFADGLITLTFGIAKYGKYSDDSYIIPIFEDESFYRILGFERFYKNLRSGFHVDAIDKKLADKAPHLNISSNYMFVYSDIIEDHRVGDTEASLLRVAPLSSGNFGKVGHLSFSNLHYFRCKLDRIESINILLCDEYGEQIKFVSGHVFLTLHFRKRKVYKTYADRIF